MELAKYLAIGRLLTWLIQTNGLTRPLFDRHSKLRELRDCDLCLGFWVYLALAPRIDLGLGWLNRVSLAAVATFMAHLLRLGWEVKFKVTVIE